MNLELHSNSKIEIWSTFFQHLEGFTESVNLLFYSDRFYIQTMDKSHVAVCELFLPASWFDVYTVHESIHGNNRKYISIGINVSMMTRILKVMSNRTLLGGEGGGGIVGGGKIRETVLKMGYEYNGDTLDIGVGIFEVGGVGESVVVGGLGEKIQEYMFELPLVFLPHELMNIPTDTEYTAEIRLSSEWMAEIVKTLKGFGDTVELECSENEIAISVSGIEQGMMRVPISTDKLAFFSIEEGAELDVYIRLKYMCIMASFHKLSKQLVLRMEKDRPIQWMYSLEVGGGDGGVVGELEEGDVENEIEKDPDARLVLYLVQCDES
jgi:hypothetical protein